MGKEPQKLNKKFVDDDATYFPDKVDHYIPPETKDDKKQD